MVTTALRRDEEDDIENDDEGEMEEGATETQEKCVYAFIASLFHLTQGVHW
jgi:hypothetical protein